MNFVHLDAHSNFSLLEGTIPVEKLAAAAARAGMTAVALTDTNGMYAVVPFARACASHGIRPVFGAEIEHGGRRAVALARDRAGYSELCRLVTARHLDPTFNFTAAISSLSDHIVLLTDDAETLLAAREKQHVYVAVRHSGGPEGRQAVLHGLVLAEQVNRPPVALNGTRFLKPADHNLHRVLTAIRTNSTVGALPPGALASPSCWFKDETAMVHTFALAPQALDLTQEIAAMCDVDLELGKPKPPDFPLPAGETHFSFLCKLTFQGLTERYRPVSKEAYDTLSRELDVIERLHLAGYFLVCWDIVRFARSKGMPCLGRGSAANSIASYCLYITHVDPLKHNMFFERFLNLERESFPDFDIDFATEDREEVFRYVFDKYGHDRVAMICTYATLRARGAIRDTAAAYGLPKEEIDPLVEHLPHFTDLDKIEETVARHPGLRGLPIDKEPYRQLLAIARRLSGFPRHLGTHPCGIVVAPSPITDFMPLQRGDKGLEITQWSMYPVEDAGLIKIDLLGQKGLATLTETIQAVSRQQGKTVDSAAIDYLGDERTREWMRTGRSEGCFYIESPIMMQLLEQARCDSFEVLTALSSIIRPGVSNYGGKRQYLHRHLGLEPVAYLHPSLERILGDTYGCLIYQEQVIQIAAAAAGMSLGEADGLRRCMSKKRNWEKMETYRERFLRGARERGIGENVAQELFRQIESFAGYAFCKAHSASFALESFMSLYWKCHYPAEFMAAVLSNQGGYYTPLEYIEEARRLGLTILGPDINQSQFRFTGSGRDLRVGLMQVRSLSARAGMEIPAERERNGPYASIPDLIRRVQLSHNEAFNLGKCGALDAFACSRSNALWIVEMMYGGKQKPRHDNELFREPDPALLAQIPAFPQFDLRRRLSLDLEMLSLCVAAHPLAMFPEKVEKARRLRPVAPASTLRHRDKETVYCLGWWVTGKRTVTSRKKEIMAFVTFSDESGRFEGAFFPNVYERYAQELQRGPGPFLVKGACSLELGSPTLTVSDVKML